MKNLIVVGNGMVGHHFIEKAIENAYTRPTKSMCLVLKVALPMTVSIYPGTLDTKMPVN